MEDFPYVYETVIIKEEYDCDDEQVENYQNNYTYENNVNVDYNKFENINSIYGIYNNYLHDHSYAKYNLKQFEVEYDYINRETQDGNDQNVEDQRMVDLHLLDDISEDSDNNHVKQKIDEHETWKINMSHHNYAKCDSNNDYFDGENQDSNYLQDYDEDRIYDSDLIKTVRRFPCIYTSNTCRKTLSLNDAWKRIALSLNDSEEHCKQRWTCLRRYFCRERQKRKLKNNSKLWCLYDDMAFLSPYMKKRKKIVTIEENINDTPSDVSISRKETLETIKGNNDTPSDVSISSKETLELIKPNITYVNKKKFMSNIIKTESHGNDNVSNTTTTYQKLIVNNTNGIDQTLASTIKEIKKKKKKTVLYSTEDLNKALKAIHKGETFGKVSKKFGIPKSTLHSKIIGAVPEHCRKGPLTTLTREEEIRLKKWIIDRAEIGYPTYTNEVKEAVQYILVAAKRESEFTNNRPSDNWFIRFLGRHPEVKKKNDEVISKSRTPAIKPFLRQWYQQCQVYLKKRKFENILNRPKSIFSADEIGVKLAPIRVNASGVEEDFHEVSPWYKKATCRVLCTFSAAGDISSPMIVYSHEQTPSDLDQYVPDGWAVGKSESGRIISTVFYEYIVNVFYPWCQQNSIEFPVIFFVDGGIPYVNLQLSDFCFEHNIIIYPLLHDAKNIIQPCSVIFKELKEKWRTVLHKYQSTSQQSLRKVDFAPSFKKALDQISITSITNAFQKCGLYPWNEKLVNLSRYHKLKV